MASFDAVFVGAFPARIQVGHSDMKACNMHPARSASIEDIQHQMKSQNASSTFIDSLWNNPLNADLVSQFLNNKFCATCARSSDEECLPLYQRYSVQDYFYLEDYVKYKALRLNTLPVGNLTALEAEVSSVLSDAESAISAGQSYVKDLHGNTSDLAEGNRNIEELAYGNWLQNSASSEDWFNLHVMIIPCIYGWTKLADGLLNDPSTKNDTIFFSTWIQPNTDPSYANDLSAFLDANKLLWENEVDTGTEGTMGKWNSLFRTALQLEVALFASPFDK
ncbi:MAG: hypothetical protein Q9165_007132 [Trypethelium subeluteriae]